MYNLSTKGGWYVSSGIITHNCDCRIMPGWPRTSIEGYDPDEVADRWQDAIDDKAAERADRNGTTVEQERRKIMSAYGEAARRAKKRSKRK